MKLFVCVAAQYDDRSTFAVFSSREAAEAHALYIENAVCPVEADHACIAEGRDCASCPGREECVDWAHKWACSVFVKELELDVPAGPKGFEF